MNKAQYLLDDLAMQRFIADGYLQVDSGLPEDYHDRVFKQLEPLSETGLMGHNNLLPCAPLLQELIESPVVKGTLESLIGPEYHLHFHRHDHRTLPGGEQGLHKDGDNHSHQAIDHLRRPHPTRYVMMFYYPQDTTLDMGPTCLVPQSQYLPRREVEKTRAEFDRLSRDGLNEVRDQLLAKTMTPQESEQAVKVLYKETADRHPELAKKNKVLEKLWKDKRVPLVGPAGTLVFVHFDIVHARYSANELGLPRHMVKFLFTRNNDPTNPSWNHADPKWRDEDQSKSSKPMKPVWLNLWNWHLGNKSFPGSVVTDVQALCDRVKDSNDELAISAAYELAQSQEGIEALIEIFDSKDTNSRNIAAYGLQAGGEASVDHLAQLMDKENPKEVARVIDVLGDIGPPAIDALELIIKAASSQSVVVRRYAIEAIGLIAQHLDECEGTLIQKLENALKDEDAIVRRNSAFSIAQLGNKVCSELIVDGLIMNLQDWHHHVRGWSIEALQRLDNERALKAAIKYLNLSRWDAFPKSGDRTISDQVMRQEDPVR
ncbi:MAG: HEAT repeat domain-containing protein [Candidatus Azotimanducaceae bacterium]